MTEARGKIRVLEQDKTRNSRCKANHRQPEDSLMITRYLSCGCQDRPDGSPALHAQNQRQPTVRNGGTLLLTTTIGSGLFNGGQDPDQSGRRLFPRV